MSVLPVGFGASGASSYSIGHSVRLRGAQYLSKTFGSAGGTTWALSMWVKRGAIGAVAHGLFSAGDSEIYFRNATTIDSISFYKDGANVANSTAVFRDPTAHGHFVFVSNGTTVKAHFNSVEVLSYTGTIPDLNSAVAHTIGKYAGGASDYLDGYLSDIYFIDGQALTPTDFGKTNADGVWVPKAYTGSYGTNGFHLDFADGASQTTMGYDAAGTNDWTLSWDPVSAGVTYDWMTDTPTNNFATLSPINKPAAPLAIISSGNLKLAPTEGVAFASFPVPVTGKWVWEATLSTLGLPDYGICNATKNGRGNATGMYGTYCNGGNGLAFYNGSNTAADGRQAVSAGDIAIVAIDSDNNKVWIGRNRAGTLTWMGNGNPVTGTSPSFSASGGGGVYSTGFSISSSDWYPEFAVYTGDEWNTNFGQRAFSTTALTDAGFLALCTANLPAVAITNPREHFDAAKYIGNGTVKQVRDDGNGNALLLLPDLIWAKSRVNALHHAIVDRVRGNSNILFSDLTSAEINYGTTFETLSSGVGFDVTYDADYTATTQNHSGDTCISWLWKAGGAGVSNTQPANGASITSVYSANQTAGFSIVSYTGDGAASGTIYHGLNSVPKMIIVKNRDVADSGAVYHYNGGTTTSDGKDYFLRLFNATGTQARDATGAMWNDTAPTTAVFSVGTEDDVNAVSEKYIAYVFAEIPGYSKFGSYIGNGVADGTFVYCGFRPRWILIKDIGSASNWYVFDSAMDTYNMAVTPLRPNTAESEGTISNPTYYAIDVLSNGFKLRGSSSTEINASGYTCVYAAFAEFPMGGSNCSPSPAR